MSLPGFHFAPVRKSSRPISPHGRHTVRKQENTDEHHREDGGQCTEEKYHVHQVFPKVFHKSFSYIGTGRIASPCFISL